MAVVKERSVTALWAAGLKEAAMRERARIRGENRVFAGTLSQLLKKSGTFPEGFRHIWYETTAERSARKKLAEGGWRQG